MIYTETNINHTPANVNILLEELFGQSLGKQEFAQYNKDIGR